MPGDQCFWDLDDDPGGNVQHIAQHGLSKEDIDHAIEFSSEELRSDSSGLPLIFGPALDGSTIVVVYERIDESSIYPVTAYRPSKR